MPVSNSDNLSSDTIVGGQDGNIMINSNSLESVPSLMSDVCTQFFSEFRCSLS